MGPDGDPQAPSARAPLCAPPHGLPQRATWPVPALACDCHAHVIGPHAQYPLSPDRVYTPPECPTDAYLALLDSLGITRAVLVQPSIYGHDNRLLMHALARAPGRLRGVAVVDADVPEHDLAQMHAHGVRGVRFNLVDRHDPTPDLPWAALEALAARVRRHDWHLELLVHAEDLRDADLARLLALGVPIVVAHLGYPRKNAAARARAADVLLAGLASGRLWVKLTGPYRISAQALPYPEADELAATLREAAPQRLLWGSDWPHVNLQAPAMPGDGALLDLLPRWLPERTLREQVLVHNPAVLYGFA